MKIIKTAPAQYKVDLPAVVDEQDPVDPEVEAAEGEDDEPPPAEEPTPEEGSFEALVAVFGNVDYAGDMVMPGAFTDSLAEWKSSGDSIPVLWSHRMDDPSYNIGSIDDAAELEPNDPRIPEWADPHVKANGGLWVRGHIDVGPDASPIAVQARRLLKQRRVRKFSYAYDVLDAKPTTKDGKDVLELRKLRLFEVSPTQVGANDLTELVDAKARTLTKAGRVLSAKNESTIREAVTLLTGVLAALDGDAGSSEPAKAESPSGVKAEEPATARLSTVRQHIDLCLNEVEVIVPTD